MLTPQQGQVLVRWARQQIEHHLEVAPSRPVDAGERRQPELQQVRGVFVTLHKRSALRGCIGSLTGVEPVVDGVRRHALNAAFHDHRFQPLTAAELAELHVEVSVLTEPRPLSCEDADQLLRLLRPGIDGVILEGPGGAGATFLPQVWRQLPEPEQFLGHLCRKAGLAEDAWRSGRLHISTYQVQSFEEPRSGGNHT
ncbi:AmmeMemoRadiSam system protein A [Desulfobulbus elongatus]|uniref:AmmeMemoRadiSam system protein A n=1 Tax=Desulfobulbus elongatus TaxID=53332 RepID=UPI000482787E|nr:AmmeMemoRadiSam system protein A [Desulfobulbus elongatus]